MDVSARCDWRCDGAGCLRGLRPRLLIAQVLNIVLTECVSIMMVVPDWAKAPKHPLWQQICIRSILFTNPGFLDAHGRRHPKPRWNTRYGWQPTLRRCFPTPTTCLKHMVKHHTRTTGHSRLCLCPCPVGRFWFFIRDKHPAHAFVHSHCASSTFHSFLRVRTGTRTSNSWTPTADKLQYLIDHLRAQAQLNDN